MKNSLVVFLLCLLFVTSKAQQAYFNPSNFNKELFGRILLKDGTVKDIKLWYDHPDFLKRHDVVLKASDGPISKATLEAFSIDGHTWVFRHAPTGDAWVVLTRQGEIEVFDYVTSDSEGKNTALITMGTAIRKGATQLIQSKLVLTFKKNMTPLVSDFAELAAKVGEKGYGFMQYMNVVDEYNVWFEKNNPGKITYLAAQMGVPTPTESNIKGTAGIATTMEGNKTSATEKTKKRLDSLFTNRSTTVAPEVASAADNTPAKKETFSAKITRIQSDGNKIGVLFNLKPARSVKNQTGTMQLSNLLLVEGEYFDESLQTEGQRLVEELNAAYQTTLFELIDLSKIPYREVKVFGQTTRVDDWWATKYKVVFALTIDPHLEATREEFGGKIKSTAAVNFSQSLLVTEYVGGMTSTKQDIIAQMLDFGGFRTPSYSQESEMADPYEIYIKSVEKEGVPIAEKLGAKRAVGLRKLVEKKLIP